MSKLEAPRGPAWREVASPTEPPAAPQQHGQRGLIPAGPPHLPSVSLPQGAEVWAASWLGSVVPPSRPGSRG